MLGHQRALWPAWDGRYNNIGHFIERPTSSVAEVAVFSLTRLLKVAPQSVTCL